MTELENVVLGEGRAARRRWRKAWLLDLVRGAVVLAVALVLWGGLLSSVAQLART